MDLTHINLVSGFFGVSGGAMVLFGNFLTGLTPAQRLLSLVLGYSLLAVSFLFTALRHRKSDEHEEYEAVLVAASSVFLFALSPLMPSPVGSLIVTVSGLVLLFSSVVYYHLIHVYPRLKERLKEFSAISI